MSDIDWRELYRTALTEVDPGLLHTSIAAAEAAIHAHVETMTLRTSSLDERQAISDAVASLRVIKNEPRCQPEPQENTLEIAL